MKHNFFHNVTWLDVENNDGQGNFPMPSDHDYQVVNLLRRWVGLTTAEKIAASPSESQAETLLGWSERSASRAVRDGNDEWIFLGLIAVGLACPCVDPRDAMMVLSLHYDACRRLNLSPENTFQNAAKEVPPSGSKAINEFLDRNEEDRSIVVMGYEAGRDADGFLYRRTW